MSPAGNTTLPFDVWHPDGLVFDDEPEAFILETSCGLVFTTRGIEYFGPRFKHVGRSVSAVTSRAAFDEAYGRWLDVERVLLQEKIDNGARNGSSDYGALSAIMSGDLGALEAAVNRLEHRARANLKVVAKS